MREVPNSYLWILKPSDKPTTNNSTSSSSTQILQHLYSVLAAHGIAKQRLLFAERIDKHDHIERHAAADLFLDSFYYGAHSTATDALRGGLPVLTIKGGSFPERVASSLYHSFVEDTVGEEGRYSKLLEDTLITYSVKDYVDLAVKLAKSRSRSALSLKVILWKLVAKEKGCFNAVEHNRKLLTSISAMQDERLLNEGIISRLEGEDSKKLYNATIYDFKKSNWYSSNKRWHLVLTNNPIHI